MMERFEKNFKRKAENAVNQHFSFFFFFNIFHSMKENSSCFRLHFDLFVFCKYFQFRPAQTFIIWKELKSCWKRRNYLSCAILPFPTSLPGMPCEIMTVLLESNFKGVV